MNEFNPDWVSPPGETIIDILDERNVRVEAFAAVMDMTLDDVGRLLTGRVNITPEIAEKLSRHLGSSKQFWINREANYRKRLGK